MNRLDPSRPPRANLSQRPVAAASAAITRNMVDSLARTRPWVLLIGIVMIMGCAFMVLAGLGMIVMGGAAGLGGGEYAAYVGPGLGALYLVFAVLYLFPALHLVRYAGAIRRMGPANPGAMEEALARQASFWRFVGVLTVLLIGLYVVVIAVVVVVAALGAASATPTH